MIFDFDKNNDKVFETFEKFRSDFNVISYSFMSRDLDLVSKYYFNNDQPFTKHKIYSKRLCCVDRSKRFSNDKYQSKFNRLCGRFEHFRKIDRLHNNQSNRNRCKI